jgi:hypothetical protein
MDSKERHETTTSDLVVHANEDRKSRSIQVDDRNRVNGDESSEINDRFHKSSKKLKHNEDGGDDNSNEIRSSVSSYERHSKKDRKRKHRHRDRKSKRSKKKRNNDDDDSETDLDSSSSFESYDSEDDSSDDDDDDNRRHRKKKKTKHSSSRRRSKSHKDKKDKKKHNHHKKKKSKKSRREYSSDESDSSHNEITKSSRHTDRSTESTALTFGKYGIIKATDFNKMQRTFEVWLAEVKGIHAFTGPKYELLKYFDDYREDYNTATLPHIKYYDYEKWEMDEYQKQQQQQQQLQIAGSSKNAKSDEFLHQQEQQRRAKEKRRLEEIQLLSTMNREKVQDMKHQADLRTQMQIAFKTGDKATYRRLKEKLEADE